MTASELLVAFCRLVILYEFMDKFPLGYTIEFKATVFEYLPLIFYYNVKAVSSVYDLEWLSARLADELAVVST